MLGILCARSINLPLLNLTANVAVKKLAQELKSGQASQPAAPAPPARPVPPPVLAVTPPSAPPAPAPPPAASQPLAQGTTGESASTPLLIELFAKDPERIRVFAESEKHGPIVEQVTVTILRPAAFSPMK